MSIDRLLETGGPHMLGVPSSGPGGLRTVAVAQCGIVSYGIADTGIYRRFLRGCRLGSFRGAAIGRSTAAEWDGGRHCALVGALRSYVTRGLSWPRSKTTTSSGS